MRALLLLLALAAVAWLAVAVERRGEAPDAARSEDPVAGPDGAPSAEELAPPPPEGEPPPRAQPTPAAEPAPTEDGPTAVVGRVLDESGEPVPDTFFAGGMLRDDESVSGMPVQTDGAGRFRWAFFDRIGGPLRGLTIVFQHRTDGMVSHRVEVPLPPLAKGELLDLGDLRLRPHAGSVRVRLVDDGGAPVVDPEIDVEAFDLDGRQVDREDARGDSLVLDTRGADRVRFALRSDRWLLAEPERVAAPGDEVTLVVVRGGRIAGQVLLPEGTPRDWLYVRAAPSGGDERGRYGEWEGTGEFVIDGLREGPHRVEVVRNDLPLARVEGVAVRFAEVTRDPRLDPLDLQGAMQRAEIVVRERDGRPVGDARLFLADGERFADYRTDSSGVAQVDLPLDRGLRLFVTSPRHAPATVEGVTGDREVRLEPGIRASVRTSRVVELDIGSHGADLLLRPDPVEGAPRWLRDVHPGWDVADGEPHELVFPGPGRYRLHVMVLQRIGTMLGRMQGQRYHPADVFVEVSARDHGATLVLPMPEDVFACDPTYEPEEER